MSIVFRWAPYAVEIHVHYAVVLFVLSSWFLR